jgi:ribA/ribD-fused uncharacterized protein
MIAIRAFKGKYAFLSNFYPCSVMLDGHIYPSVEHAYQAAKYHPSQRAQLRDKTLTSAWAKRLGRKAPLPADWETQKVGVMRQLIAEKFVIGTRLATELLLTGDRPLIEGNTWGDTYWGVCRGEGQNVLGKLLEERRAELKKAIAP